MILDSSLSLDPVGTALTATRPSTNVIDIGDPRDIGVHHRNLYLNCQVTSALVGPAGTTLNVQWQGSTDNATWNVIAESGPQPAVAVAIGTRFLAMEIPRQAPNSDGPGGLFRYYRLNYVVGGGPLTQGAFSATLVLERQDTVTYRKNFNVNS